MPRRDCDYCFCGPKPFMAAIYRQMLARGIPGSPRCTSSSSGRSRSCGGSGGLKSIMERVSDFAPSREMRRGSIRCGFKSRARCPAFATAPSSGAASRTMPKAQAVADQARQDAASHREDHRGRAKQHRCPCHRSAGRDRGDHYQCGLRKLDPRQAADLAATDHHRVVEMPPDMRDEVGGVAGDQGPQGFREFLAEPQRQEQRAQQDQAAKGAEAEATAIEIEPARRAWPIDCPRVQGLRHRRPSGRAELITKPSCMIVSLETKTVERASPRGLRCDRSASRRNCAPRLPRSACRQRRPRHRRTCA